METEQERINANIRLLMRHSGDTQKSLSSVLEMSQPQVSLRLRSGEGSIEWKVGELVRIADHFGMPFEKLFQHRAVVQRWLGEQLIDLSEQPNQVLSWDAFTQSDDPQLQFELPIAS